MEANVHLAGHGDLATLAALMIEFYGEGGFPLSAEAAEHTFAALLDDSSLGRIWLVELDAVSVGYVVLTFGYSMEFGGTRGFVDDFFIRPSARNRGLGASALVKVRETCEELGVRALLVETGPDDHPARRLYARAGFNDSGRVLLSQELASPVHET